MNPRLHDLGLLLLRVMFGAGITYAGYMKLFGGYRQMFLDGVTAMGFPMPVVFGWAAMLSEFAGGLLLILGLGTRLAAFFIACTMMVATFIATAPEGLEKMHLPAAYLTVSLALLMTGGGRFALERAGRTTPL